MAIQHPAPSHSGRGHEAVNVPDPLARLEPVARPLLAEVDRALATLGAPPGHPIWSALRRVGATPADAVALMAGWEPSRLRSAGENLRGQARAYAEAPILAPTGWQGPAASEFAGHASALASHLSTGPQSMAERLAATAAYADAVAEWIQQARSAVAGALADVMTSAQAVAIRTTVAGSLAASLTAAADVGAYVLDVVDEVLAEGEALPDVWEARLARVEFSPPAEAPIGSRSIDVHH